MAGKICQICGASSGIYPLCKEHLEMKSKGLVLKNDETGKWELIETKINQEETGKCRLCNQPTTNENHHYCKDCYYNIIDRMDELDKNQKPTKLKDYYYNAKDYAMRIYNEDKIYYQLLTMSAISNILIQVYNDSSINDRLEKDIQAINNNLETKNKKLNEQIKEKTKIEEIKIENDREKAKFKKTQDGHFVQSEFEIKVDDLLYTNNILHAYDVRVDEITERTVNCDWYLPVINDKGIYIELWGMKGDDKYTRNQKEKIELYKKHNLPLIEIEYDELKDDTQRLRSSIKSQINKLKNEILEKQKV